MNAKSTGASFAAGLLFAVGLGLAGMTQPTKVIGFLDFAGLWDPSLALVMVSAIGISVVAYRIARLKGQPLFDTAFHWPTRRDIDPRLVGGAALFGVGWGLAGYCPGPGLVSLGAGGADAAVFSLAMAAGLFIAGSQPRPSPDEDAG